MTPLPTRPANFRDLALHVPVDLRLRPRTLYRSDHLGALDENDSRQIHALGIARVIDFRGVTERESAACRVPGVAVHSLAIEPTIVQKLHTLLDAGAELSADDVVELMRDTYRGFVRTNSDRFREFFGHLLEKNEPTVFHCTAGKDRTGFAAALVLGALDVPHEHVLADYLATNDHLNPDGPQGWTLPPQVAHVMYRVQPEFLQAAFDAVDEDYGGLEGYLRDGLGLREPERARLRELYLVPA
ncbi:tyrosine-protein phosphatase [Ramlibacter sp.]|uniref:tyrosine-protein phosphatase n=1 Tax=Ramlibacter sp. TaxID=1917967 RepID=UPI003D12EC91